MLPDEQSTTATARLAKSTEKSCFRETSQISGMRGFVFKICSQNLLLLFKGKFIMRLIIEVKLERCQSNYVIL